MTNPADDKTEGTDHAATIDTLTRERNEARRDLKDAKTKLGTLESTVGELQDFKTKVESDGLSDVQKLQQQVDTISAERQDLQSKFDAAQSTIDGMNTRARSEAVIDAIAASTGVANRSRLRGLLREAAETKGIDIAPEKLDDGTRKSIERVLKDIDPETFDEPTKPKGGAVGTAGDAEPLDTLNKLHARRLAGETLTKEEWDAYAKALREAQKTA